MGLSNCLSGTPCGQPSPGSESLRHECSRTPKRCGILLLMWAALTLAAVKVCWQSWAVMAGPYSTRPSGQRQVTRRLTYTVERVTVIDVAVPKHKPTSAFKSPLNGSSKHTSTSRRSSGRTSRSGKGGSKITALLPQPLLSTVPCGQENVKEWVPTARELDLQQQRRCALAQAGHRPAGGYLALCLAVRNQHLDLPEWLDYYGRMGVSHVYAIDDHSDPPLDSVLEPYIKDGFVTHQMRPGKSKAVQVLHNATCRSYYRKHKQLQAYNLCLRDYGTLHQWMGFIDVDEYLVLLDGTPSLPALLRDYEDQGGLAVNWRMFGSSGHKTRQANTLLSYTKCNLPHHPENTHVKLFANMKYITRMNGAHSATYAPGYSSVTASGLPVHEPWSNGTDFSRAALNHYVLKSEAEYRERMERGNVMGGGAKDLEYWAQTEATAIEDCTTGVQAWQRLYVSAKEKPLEQEELRKQQRHQQPTGLSQSHPS